MIMGAICAQVARARAIYPQVPKPGRPDWWARPPEAARLRSCRGRVAQAMIDEAAASSPEASFPENSPAPAAPPVQP
jgi:hypothetical protein